MARLVGLAVCVGLAVVGCNTRVEQRRIVDRLTQADPEALLAACREVLANGAAYRVNPRYNGGTSGLRGRAPDPQDPAMPLALRRVQPTYVEVFEDSVHLGFAAGWHSVDVMAFAKGVDDAARGRQIGPGRRLTPGLWLYQDVE